MAVRLSASRAGRPPFTPRKIPGTHLYQRLSRPQGHSAAGRISSFEKKSNELIWNRTRDLSACSIVPEPTTLPHVSPPPPGEYKDYCFVGCDTWSDTKINSVSEESVTSIFSVIYILKTRAVHPHDIGVAHFFCLKIKDILCWETCEIFS
jgi:hypothetical protein